MGGPNHHKWTTTILALILALGVLALRIDPISFGDTRARPVRPINGNRDETLGPGPFKLNRVDPNTEGHQRPTEVDSRGCWSATPRAFGTHETGWYEAKDKFILVVAGFPSAPGNRLEIEFSAGRGQTEVIPFRAPNPQNTWEPWYLAAPKGASSFRVRAVNSAGGPNAWFAFSEPFAPRMPFDWQVLADLQLMCTTCLALALICGPCLVIVARCGRNDGAIFAYSIVAGPLLMASIGGLCWALGGWIAPQAIARVCVGCVLVWLGRQLYLHRAAGLCKSSGIWATITASALIVCFGVAKANMSVGPPGELYGGTVSRSLEVGGHSDSRIAYHVVQLVAHHLAPFGQQATGYFGSWSFAARGPLAGLVAAPLVLATGALVPDDMPDQPWRPFDRQGFATYRIALMTLASLAGWAFFAVTAAITAPKWGALAAAVALLTPFFVHETYFTWPKLIASGMSLVAFLLIHRRKPAWAGLGFGIGYLFHPLILLMGPFLLLWSGAVGAPSGVPVWKRLLQPSTFGFAALACILPWQVVGRFAPSGSTQAVFFTYFQGADEQPATWPTWWASRWQNFANTFLPFHLLSVDPNHESINSVYAPSPWWVHSGFLYWNTLPFAVGLPAFVLLAAAIGRMTFSTPRITAVWLYGPAAFLVAYWGVADTGLMRHCGQPLFVSFVVLGVWSIYSANRVWLRSALSLFLHPICFVWRGLEVGIMAFATTLINGFPHWNSIFALNDVVSFIAALFCLGITVLILMKQEAIKELFCSPPDGLGELSN